MVNTNLQSKLEGREINGLEGHPYENINTSAYISCSHISQQMNSSTIKESNYLLEPFALHQRNTDEVAEKNLRLPHNPIGIKVDEKKLPSFHHFCRQRNIPFNENEKRYYMMAKQKY